jgi:hypothetical protein
MTRIPETNEKDNALQKRFAYFIKHYRINDILRSVNATKEKGVSVYAIFVTLLGLVFTHKNLYTLLNTNRENLTFGKDVVYRFLRKSYIRWEIFLFRLSIAVIPEVKSLTSEERRCVLIVDDTPYYRNRSRDVELLSRCYDHSERRYYKGFTMLNLGWSDGQTFIPVDFRLLASGNDKNLLEGSHVEEDNRTIATKRRKDARRDKPALVLEMLQAVKGTPAQTKHVLFDSWYASPSAILSIKETGYDVITRLKNHENYRYLFEGETLSLSQIYKMSKKRRGRSRFLLSTAVAVRHNDFPESIPAKIVFVRDKHNRKRWIALLSSDITLSEDEIITLYGKRWDIEPFHKILKSCLHLTTEFQLRSFDAITAHAAIVLTRYIFLALENRSSKDERTLGELFFLICDELEDISFALALELIISTLKQCLGNSLHLAESHILSFVEQFINDLPALFKDRIAFQVWSSRRTLHSIRPSQNRAGAINAHGSSQADL